MFSINDCNLQGKMPGGNQFETIFPSFLSVLPLFSGQSAHNLNCCGLFFVNGIPKHIVTKINIVYQRESIGFYHVIGCF